MFGEKSMLGTYIVTVDSKGRIFLPKKFTYAEKGDELVLVLEDGCYALYRKDGYDIEIGRFKKRYLNAENSKIRKKAYEDMLDACKKIQKCLTIDSNNRASLTPIYEANTNLELIGAQNSIKIMKLSK